MATTRSYLFHTYLDPTTNAAGLTEDQADDGTLVSTATLASSSTYPAFDTDLAALSIDPHRQTYFFTSQQAYSQGTSNTVTDIPIIYSGSTATGAPSGTALVTANFGITDYNYQTGSTILINDTAVDQTNGRLYFTRDYEVPVNGTRGIDKPADNAVDNGLYYVSETGGTPVAVATGFSNPDAIALDASQGYAFVTDSTGVGYSGDQAYSHNTIDAVNLATGTVTTLLSEQYHPDKLFGTTNYGGNVLDGVAVDPTTNTLYFTQSDEFNDLDTDAYPDTNDGVYKATYSIGANGTVSLGPVTALYTGAGTHDPGRISIDPADGVFYVVGNTVDPSGSENQPTGYGIWEGSLTSVNGTQLTAVDVPAPAQGTEEFGYSTFDVPGDANAALDVVPTLTAGSAVTYRTTGGAVVADAGLSTSSTTSSYYNTAAVTISSGFKAGDVLAATTTGTAIAANYAAGTGILTLSGSDTLAHYRQVLASVTFSSTAGNPTAGGTDDGRTLTYSVFDGIATGTASSTVNIQQPAAVASGSPAVTFTGGGSAVAADPALTITSGSSATLAGATVSISGGFLNGDTLGFVNGNGITGSYNSSTGVLTLSGSATVANYQAAIRSVTFGFSPANGNPAAGNDTSRTLSYTVTDGTSASSPATSTVSVVHAAPSVVAGATATFVRGGSAVAADPGLTVAAPDSGGTIASATVSITGASAPGDTLGFTAQNGITGVYNPSTYTLALTGSATAAQYQAALDSVTFSTGNAAALGNRTLSYAVNDGTASSAAATSTVSVTKSNPNVTYTAGTNATNTSDEATAAPFSGAGVSDAAGEGVTGTTITVTASGAASDANGTLSGNGLVKTGTGTYTLSATTPSGVAAQLKALVFTPTAHEVAPGATVTTGFTVAVTDTGGSTASSSAFSVTATAALDAPTITGAVANQATTDLAAVNPFSTVTITDPDFGAMPTVDITLMAGGSASDANGTLSGAGLTKIETGTYVLAAATPATLTSELEALTFTPTKNQVPVGQAVTTGFDILASLGSASTANNTTSVVATDVPCFCTGTRLATPGGEVPVEMLAAGDLVLTADGAARPVRWIGRRAYTGRFLHANPGVQPVRFRAGSLGGGLPRRDLLVSPDHAMVLDGVLIPARHLINGSTIVRERGLDRVDYVHVELDSHDALLAEGAPSESFLDDDSRGMFANAAEYAALHSDATAPGRFFAPRVEQGPELEAVRRRLAAVASATAQAA